MDPITHTFTGAALSAAGLRRATPLATATLILAANAPDVDIVAQLSGGVYASLAHRRGWTHGVLALALLPLLLAALMLSWDRLVRRRRDPTALSVRPRAILGLAYLGVLTHPALDWLNTYGMRWLMPFDGRWFYGDAVFIIDPWLWLLLGGALFLLYSARAASLAAWAAFAALASLLILRTPAVPDAARVVWFAGLTLLLVLRLRGTSHGRSAERIARGCVAAAAAYVLLMIGLDRAAESEVRRAIAAAGTTAGDVMVGPAPANPFAGSIVAVVPGGYLLGEFGWLRRPRVALRVEPLERGPADEVVRAAAAVPDARDFLVWSRFPYARVSETPAGYEVWFGDARAASAQGRGPLGGVAVQLDRELRPLASEH